MGGFGSGQRWSKKGVVEGCLSIDTSDLRKSKLLIPDFTEHAGLLLW